MGGGQWLATCLVALPVFLHLAVCPYTKVEESFNLQATHDLLFHTSDLEKYDHFEFPGVVPRTFIGPLVLSVFSWPWVQLVLLAGWTKFAAQLIVRGVLGLFCLHALHKFQGSVETVYGKTAAWYLMIATACQFHLPFYMTRPLPNVFALCLVLHGYSALLSRKYTRMVMLFVATIVIFRSELVILFGPLFLILVAMKKIPLWQTVGYGIAWGIICLGLTAGFDSLMWQKPVWPEGYVLWYNTVLNKSSDWGTSPFLWYYYSAIPRALTATMILVPFGLLNRRTWPLAASAVIFVTVYSCLPHKELRFIFYALPVFNMLGGVGASYLIESQPSNFRKYLAKGFCWGILWATLVASLLMLIVSSMNYPGGAAIHKLAGLVNQQEWVVPPNVHISVPAAQTGVSRFVENYDVLQTSKVESWNSEEHPAAFQFLITGPDGLEEHSLTHEIYFTIMGYSRLHFQRSLPFIIPLQKPALHVLKRLKQKDTTISP